MSHHNISNNQIYKLIKRYSTVLISVIVAFVTIVSVQHIVSTYNREQENMERTMFSVEQKFLQDNQRMVQLSLDLVKNQDLIDPIYAFFELSHSDYIWWNLVNSKGREDRSLIVRFQNYMVLEDELQAVVIELEGYDSFFYAERGITSGAKRFERPKVNSQYSFRKPLINQVTYDVMGFVTFYLNDTNLTNIISRNNSSIWSVFLTNNLNDIVYQSPNPDGYTKDVLEKIASGAQTIQSLEESLVGYEYRYHSLASGYKMMISANKFGILEQALKYIGLWCISGALLIGTLIGLLRRMFKDYAKQVDDIVEVIQSTRIDDYVRIDTAHKQGDLLVISESINQMLDDIKQYVDDIYGLELRQKEAELRALQAQINPHFMYNTLEYIRMNILSEGLEDLSDIVYSFATLLRNNISAEKFITLKNEVDFCQKYVSLYQMRHPKRIAYKFSIPQEVERIVMPRFILQPLIENYLIHGLDYTRIDNAISVQAWLNHDELIIEVRDNGRGMDDETYNELQELLHTNGKYRGKSMGIMNVRDRLEVYYKGNAKMSLDRNDPMGLIVRISIKTEDLDV